MSANLLSLLLILNLLIGMTFLLTLKSLPHFWTALFIIPTCSTSLTEIQDVALNLLKNRQISFVRFFYQVQYGRAWQ